MDILNEDLGNLKQFKGLPEEWIVSLFGDKRNSGREVGRDSEIEKIIDFKNYKILLKALKQDDFKAALVTIKGIIEYMITSISPNKFLVYSAKKTDSRKKQVIKEYGEIEYISILNERHGGRSRRPSYRSYEDGQYAEMSVPDISKFLEKIESEGSIEFFIIKKDLDRFKLSRERYQTKSISDPLYKEPDDYYNRASLSQNKRQRLYGEKKKAELDKEIDDVIDKLKEKVIENIDTALEKTLEDIRKGYTWNIDPDAIGKSILKGVSLSGLKRFGEAYKAIVDLNPVESSKKLKQLNFLKPKLHESFIKMDSRELEWNADVEVALKRDFLIDDEEIPGLLIRAEEELHNLYEIGWDGYDAAERIANNMSYFQDDENNY